MPERDVDHPFPQTSPRPAVFFDRDNTLILAADYLGDPREVRLMPGAAECVAGVRRLGFATVAVSNQSGVARGYFTENDVRAVNAKLDEMLRAEDDEAVIDHHDFCPHHPTHGVAPYRQACQCRKPRDGMFRRSATALNLDLGASWSIGDAPRDTEAGKSAGCRTILVTVEGIEQSPAVGEAERVQPDFRAGSLAEALEIVQRESDVIAPAADELERAFDESLGVGEPAMLVAAADERQHLVVEPMASQTEGDDLRDVSPSSLLSASASDLSGLAGRAEYEDGLDDGRSAHERVLERLISQTESEPEVEVARSPADLARTPFADRPDQPPAYVEPAGLSPQATPGAPLAGQAADRIAATTAQILDDLRRQREAPKEDFNLFRLLAGVMQVLALAAAVWGVMRDFDAGRLALGAFLQLLTITLLFASRPNA